MRFVLFVFFSFQLSFGMSQVEGETSVLFIGNSYTFYNDMPVLVKEIAHSFNRNLHVDTVVNGGKNIKFHANQPKTFEKIESRKWDYVVIQGHSDEFSQPDSVIRKNTLPYLEKLQKSILANYPCTKIVLYMTWGYKNGNGRWDKISTYETMQAMIEKQYLRTADFLSTSVSPVGIVWQNIRTNRKTINLYDPDLHHPSLSGSYLSACTFYTTIFGVSPVNSNVQIALEPKEKLDIELAAAQIVLNDRAKWRQLDRKPPMEVGYDLILQDKELELVNKAAHYDTLEWHFGDGEISTEPNVKHAYRKKGEYEIIQKIENECGVKELTRKIVVQ